MNFQERGFTLVEVLVAGLILFLTIASTTLIYRSSALSSQRAEMAIVLNGYLPFAMEKIEIEMNSPNYARSENLNGKGEVAGIRFDWSARKNLRKSPLPRLGPLGGEMIEQPARYSIWRVELRMYYQGESKVFEYQELTYQEL